MEVKRAPVFSRPRPPFVNAPIFEEGVYTFNMWVCLFKEGMELQKAQCFVTQKYNCKWHYYI